MIKGKGNGMGRAKNMGLISRGGKKHKRKIFEEYHKAQKWVSTKNGPISLLPLDVSTKDKMTNKALEEKWWLNNKRTWKP